MRNIANCDVKATTIDLIREIVKREMILPDDRIFFYNEDYVLPSDNGLWVIVAFRASKAYSNRSTTFTNDRGDFMESQKVNTQEQIAVQLMSYNLDALERKEEVMQALASIYSQQVQARESFYIAPIMQMADLSALEGGKITYRFDVLVTVMSWYEKIKKVEYYDGFTTKVRVNDGIPDMTEEFNPAVKPK